MSPGVLPFLLEVVVRPPPQQMPPDGPGGGTAPLALAQPLVPAPSRRLAVPRPPSLQVSVWWRFYQLVAFSLAHLSPAFLLLFIFLPRKT